MSSGIQILATAWLYLRHFQPFNHHDSRQLTFPLIACHDAAGAMNVCDISLSKIVELLTVYTFQLCGFCKQGGYIRTCIMCKNFASCVSKGDLIGCLPDWYLDGEQFICLECYKSVGLAPKVIMYSHTSGLPS